MIIIPLYPNFVHPLEWKISRISVFNTQQRRESTKNLHCKRHEKYQDVNTESLCEVSGVFSNGEKIYTFPIINRPKIFIFGFFNYYK